MNLLREALAAGRFCDVVELVASRLAREARLLDVAARLASCPGVVAGSVTSYAGGAPGHDPIRVGTAARAGEQFLDQLFPRAGTCAAGAGTRPLTRLPPWT